MRGKVRTQAPLVRPRQRQPQLPLSPCMGSPTVVLHLLLLPHRTTQPWATDSRLKCGLRSTAGSFIPHPQLPTNLESAMLSEEQVKLTGSPLKQSSRWLSRGRSISSSSSSSTKGQPALLAQSIKSSFQRLLQLDHSLRPSRWRQWLEHQQCKTKSMLLRPFSHQPSLPSRAAWLPPPSLTILQPIPPSTQTTQLTLASCWSKPANTKACKAYSSLLTH